MPKSTQRASKRKRVARIKPDQQLLGLIKKESAAVRASQKPEPHSFYEMTKHSAGSVRGPDDLAHHKKHMEGFGQ